MHKLLAIGLSALGGGMLFILVFAILWPVELGDVTGLGLLGAACLGGGGIAWILCGRPNLVPTDFKRTDYEAAGLLTSERFRAIRAFEVEEREDEGRHLYLELGDGRVLFLCGQYLYDYGEINDDPEVNQTATFPCTEFVLKRHKTEGWVHSIECGGRLIESLGRLPHYSEAYLKRHGFPEDGQVFDESLDVLLERIKAGRAEA